MRTIFLFLLFSFPVYAVDSSPQDYIHSFSGVIFPKTAEDIHIISNTINHNAIEAQVRYKKVYKNTPLHLIVEVYPKSSTDGQNVAQQLNDIIFLYKALGDSRNTIDRGKINLFIGTKKLNGVYSTIRQITRNGTRTTVTVLAPLSESYYISTEGTILGNNPDKSEKHILDDIKLLWEKMRLK